MRRGKSKTPRAQKREAKNGEEGGGNEAKAHKERTEQQEDIGATGGGLRKDQGAARKENAKKKV
eukprot:2424044-Pleurochrysis_carterae.AAC.1